FTAAAVQELYGPREVSIPKESTLEGILDMAKKQGLKGRSVFLPSAEHTREVLGRGLEDLGCTLWRSKLYRTEPIALPPSALAEVTNADPRELVFLFFSG